MSARSIFLGCACASALLIGASSAANATPYAFSSNQITGLTITNMDGTFISASSATTSISDSAVYNGFAPSGFQGSGPVGLASTISQAYSGPGPAPAASYTPVGSGGFTGARADAAIGAGSANTGGVSVSNVAEAYGNALGNSVGTNNAAISFTLTGTGQALRVRFTDLYELIASTAAVPSESASAAIQNSFSITDISGNVVFSNSPTGLTRQISSISGVPASNQVGPTSLDVSFLTSTLTTGQTYNIALTSTASETIQPGSVRVPEPGALGLVGFGLLAVGMLRMGLQS